MMLPSDAEIDELFDQDPKKLALRLLEAFPNPPKTTNLANLRSELDSPSRPPSSVEISQKVAEALHLLVINGLVAPALENWNPSPLWVFRTTAGTRALEKRVWHEA
jgi:hypothetical protein